MIQPEISQPPVYHVAGGRRLPILSASSRDVPMETGTVSRPHFRPVLMKKRRQICKRASVGGVIARIRPLCFLCGLVWRCVCSEGGRLNSIMQVTRDRRHQPGFSSRKWLANGWFNFRSSLHKRNRPQHRVVACCVEIWAWVFSLRAAALVTLPVQTFASLGEITSGWVVCDSLRPGAVASPYLYYCCVRMWLPGGGCRGCRLPSTAVCIILHSRPRLLYHHLPLIPSSSVL